ncbi:pseudouridine synthase [Ruixingdingia sedimenti]|uniref:Pseudouridine synthase n=1 Tax=Ruixingdingia sedimenti TaxID=3073604 RepID=A0ABU1F5B5_9RHOB|nr:pseudouridine synthase [Xinfangfangia sp. LG-4]MDR5652065.1 pseudouridine synthase [Xinfangfangia sp. LG-4]
MTKPPRRPAKPAAPAPAAADTSATGAERIAKFLSRAGVASRRDAERMVAEGRVAVNGKVIDTPATTVTAKDRVSVDGAPVAAGGPPRLWLYHKPEGLVTSARDEKGRPTVFDNLPEDMPRVMSIGRLDLNSEGLLLLTNDGELKRRLELPSTGWLRKYRVRVNGRPEDTVFEPLRKGITIEGEKFQPMTVTLDRQQGANAWLTVGIREGRNREVRRAMAAIGLVVNRLIRVSYGPFRLEDLPAGGVQEVRPRVLRDQLGLDMPAEPAPGGPVRGKAPGGKATEGKTAGKTAGKAPAPAKPAAGGKRGPAPASADRPARGGGSKPVPADRPAPGKPAARRPSATRPPAPGGRPPRRG